MLVNNYDFIEWYKLNLGIRADLITVIEDIRRGANIEIWKLKEKRGLEYFLLQKGYLEYCLKKIGLNYKEYKSDYHISKDPALLDRLWRKEIKMGEFLDYPKCCINAFERGCQQVVSTKDWGKGPAVEFSSKVIAAINEKRFNPVLLYVLHIPCDVNCKKTLRMAAKIKAVLKRADIEAAHYLEECNMNMIYEFYYYYINPITKSSF